MLRVVPVDTRASVVSQDIQVHLASLAYLAKAHLDTQVYQVLTEHLAIQVYQVLMEQAVTQV